MRFSIVLLSCLLLSACGKTGALYLPEEPFQPPVQNEQPESQDIDNGGKTD